MPIDREDQPGTISHYDDAYYAGHYGGVLKDDLNYRLLSFYWRHVLFVRNALDISGKVLDYGSGIGQVTAALPNTACFDFSPFALAELRKRGRMVFENRSEIPRGEFDYVLSSHSLEHSPTPYDDLQEFRQYVRPGGRLLLVLPIEVNLRPSLQPDWDRHLQAWTFQTITNLLSVTGWNPILQSKIYGPYMLRTLGKRIPADWAVRAAFRIGRTRRGYPAMLTVARPSS
jgi:SAM-dependent methyltransferase